MSTESRQVKISAWLAPAVGLMQRFRMSIKLAVLAALLIVPLVVVTYFQVYRLIGDYRTAHNEVQGARAVALVTDLVTAVQHHRVESLRARQTALQAAQSGRRDELAPLTTSMDAMVVQQPGLGLASRWMPLRADLQAIAASGSSEAVTAERYAKAVNDLRRLALFAGESSGLVLDPIADTYFLQDVLTEHAIPWLESVSNMRALIASAAGQTGHMDLVHSNLKNLAEQVDNRTEAVVERFESFSRSDAGAAPKEGNQAVAATLAFTKAAGEQTGKAFTPEIFAGLFDAGGKAIDAGRAFRVAAAAMLVARLEERQSTSLRQALVLGGWATVGILMVVYFLLGFSVATVNSISILHKALQEGTKGNLATRVVVPGKDELALISKEFEAMLEVLSALVADVRSASSMVTHVGGQLVEDGHSLSQRTQSQAVSLEEAASNVGQVSDTVARNSEAAQEVSLMTRSLRSEADTASDLMGKTVGAMSGVQATSDRMREIIGTIDGIAFQTNLLALNAAVEAARAGDQGKGFAVVAAEVRGLARRSQAAAAEVRNLIADSASRVSSTVKEIEAVSQLMGSLVTGISEIATNVEHMAEGSAKQSIALSEVVQAVGDLDKVTVENSGLVDRTSHRSARLMQRSRELEDAVTYIKLRQGTADEAMHLAERAYDLVQQLGYDQAQNIFHDPNGGFVDRDLYVFVFDREGVYRVMGADKKRVGTSLFDTQGVDAQQLLDDAWMRCEQGGGWVEYNIINLTTGTVKGKSSYVLPLTDTLLIGCGAYRSALTNVDSKLGH
jgi:methyl-accepting chemotaxis protein